MADCGTPASSQASQVICTVRIFQAENAPVVKGKQLSTLIRIGPGKDAVEPSTESGVVVRSKASIDI